MSDIYANYVSNDAHEATIHQRSTNLKPLNTIKLCIVSPPKEIDSQKATDEAAVPFVLHENWTITFCIISPAKWIDSQEATDETLRVTCFVRAITD